MLTPGTAAAESKGAATYLLYWRKPEEWGQVIHDWVSCFGDHSCIWTARQSRVSPTMHVASHSRRRPAHTQATDIGQTGTIMTFYEITDGDLSYTTEFAGLPTPLLRRSLDTLVKKGKAQLIRSGDGEGDGVRFL